MNQPLAKALKDIPVGEKALQHGPNAYDYSHVLEDHHREALPGHKIVVHWVPSDSPPDDPAGYMSVHLQDPAGSRLGSVEGEVYERDGDGRKFFVINSARLRGVPRQSKDGRKLYFGRKMYEAAMAHAMNAVGATHMGGGTHSTYASLAHRWLSDRHNMLYDPMPNTREYQEFVDPAVAMFGDEQMHDTNEWGYEGQLPETDDARYAPYAYTMKSELRKAENLESVEVGKQFAHSWGAPSLGVANHFDYDHLLPTDHLKDGYHLDVITHDKEDGRPFLVRARVRGPFHEGPHDYAAQVEGVYTHPAINVSYALARSAHRNKGLGRYCYEALMAHMKNVHGASELRGGEHSVHADKAHQALATKYGLAWNLKPQELKSNLENPELIGQPDLSSYALKLHEAVTDGPLEIPLAKEEIDPNDPMKARMDQLMSGYRVDAVGLQTLSREQSFEKKHLAYLLHRMVRIPGSVTYDKAEVMDVCFSHPLFSKEVADEVNAGADNDAIANQGRFYLFNRLAEYFPEIVAREGPQWVMDQAQKTLATNQKQRSDSTQPNFTLVDLSSSLARMQLKLAHNYAALLSDDSLAAVPLQHTLGDRGGRSRFVDSMLQKYGDNVPVSIKKQLLEYTKKLATSFDKSKNTYRAPGANLEREFETIAGPIDRLIKSGVPEEFTKGRLSKGLFATMIAQAPNFPVKKVKALIDHFISPQAVTKFSNTAVRAQVIKRWLSNPHLTDDQWGEAIHNYRDHVPVDLIVASPRFTAELGKKMYQSDVDDNNPVGNVSILEALRTSNKLTPELATWAMDKSIPPDRAEIVAANVAAARQKWDPLMAQTPRHASTSGLERKGGVYTRFGTLLDEFSVNPYRFSDACSRVLEATGVAGATPEFFNKYVDRYDKMFHYRPEGVSDDHSFFTRDWGDAYGYNHHNDAPFHMRSSFQGVGATITPEMDLKLAQFVVNHAHRFHHGGAVTDWINTVRAPEAIQYMLQHSNNSPVISALLGRSDATPAWIAAVEARPEYHTPPAADDARFGDGNGVKETAQGFHQNIREAVINSPALPPERLHSMLLNARTFGEVQPIVKHQNFQPESTKWLLAAKPTVFGEPLLDANGNRIYDLQGNPTRQVVEQGDVPWGSQQHGSLVRMLLDRGHLNSSMPADMWKLLVDHGWMKFGGPTDPNTGAVSAARDTDAAARIALLATTADNIPAEYIDKMYDSTHPVYQDWRVQGIKEKLLSHPKLSVDRIMNVLDNVVPEKAPTTFQSILSRPGLTQDLHQRVMDKANSFQPPVPDLVPVPNAAVGRAGLKFKRHPVIGSNMVHFWNWYTTNHASPEWLREQKSKMEAQQRQIEEFNVANPNNQFQFQWQWEDMWGHVGNTLGLVDPDSKYDANNRVKVKVGSHPYRVLRDLIEASGGQVHISEIQKHPLFSKLKLDQARVVRQMTPEEYAKKFANVPEKKRPPLEGLKVKTDFISSDGVQKVLDSIPANDEWNVSGMQWGAYRGQMSHNTAKNQVFQFNLTTDQIRRVTEAGLLPILRKLQGAVLRGGGTHPMTGDTLGWIRHYGVQPDNTLLIDEIQSDIRPPGGSWTMAWKGANKMLPGQTEPWDGQSIRSVVRGSYWGGSFPYAEMDKLHEIIWGGKQADPHLVMLEALHQQLRQQGHHNVKIYLPDAGMQASMRYGSWANLQTPEERQAMPIPPTDAALSAKGMQHAPVHMYETHNRNPALLGYDMRSHAYGDGGVAMQDNPAHKGWPMHTTKVSKKEDWARTLQDLTKAIADLPTLPFVRSTGGDRIYNANHYLTPEHRRLGYTMAIRLGTGQFGDYSIAEIKHGSKNIGGASSYIGPERIDGDKKRRDVQLDYVGLEDKHTGKGLGLPMYEALMATAKSHWGCTHVVGLHHSDMAHKVHLKLAQKHGLEYTPQASVNSSAKYPWEPYSYAI